MARKQHKYKRFPGRPFTPFEVRSLWQGPDHLLWVERVFFKETYKRFFYSDIQSVILQRTDTHMLWSFIWGVLSLICGLIAFLVQGTPYASATFTVVFLLALGANLSWGPSCRVYLQTAAQLQKISSLKRVRTAQKAMDRIKVLVEAVQGPLERPKGLKALSTDNGAQPAQAPHAGIPAALAQQRLKADPVGPFNPRLHRAMFGLLLVLGAIALIQMTLKSLPLAVAETLIHGAAQIMVIVALVRWHRHLRGTLVSKINWLALVYTTVVTLISYGIFIAVSISNPRINYHHWAMFKKIFELQWIDHPIALAVNLIYTAGALLLGVGGLLVLRRRPWTRTAGPENGEPKTAAPPAGAKR